MKNSSRFAISSSPLAWQSSYDLPGLFRATEEELASARQRVREADEILGRCRQELVQAELAQGYLFPELHDNDRGGL